MTQAGLSLGVDDEDFYRPPPDELCQGDIFSNLLVYRADAAATRVQVVKLAGNKSAWGETPKGNLVVLPVDEYPCIVLLHDCAIDKSINAGVGATDSTNTASLQRRQSKTDVTVSPVRPVPETWDDEKLASVGRGDVYHQFLLKPFAPAGFAGGVRGSTVDCNVPNVRLARRGTFRIAERKSTGGAGRATRVLLLLA